ncbi:TIGR01620 family protein [Pasteurella sp. PK-2025]|uniref:TIGR01620 family protein n=1 Tax=Pasteurella sp. PK-2025 TaxID=3413133 RepID=UPI003C714CEE
MNDKREFSQEKVEKEWEDFQGKREFIDHDLHVEPDLTENVVFEGELLEDKFEQSITPRSPWWKTGLILTALLFLLATIAQSIQWLIETWQQNQWIYFAFSLVTCLAVFLGVSAIAREWWRLAKLKRRSLLQEKGEQLLLESAVSFEQTLSSEKYEQAKQLCLEMATMLNLSEHDPKLVQWQKQVQEGYSAQEVAQLFSQIVLQPFDKQVKRLISKSAVESAVIVAISPLAIVDMLFLAWRNIRLVNQIAHIYGIELGYWSRLRLLKMVLLNLAFAGATEVVQDVGLDWLSQDLAAKLSSRAAQGIGVGLLTARLGIKAMAFCRPLAFTEKDKPRLQHIQQELLSALKAQVFRTMQTKEKQKG